MKNTVKTVCAWVITEDDQVMTTEALKDYCRGKIAHFKVPGMVRTVTEFPMTVTGKPQKFEMRKAMVEALNLTESTGS